MPKQSYNKLVEAYYASYPHIYPPIMKFIFYYDRPKKKMVIKHNMDRSQ